MTSILDGVELVLNESRTPLNYREITERLLASGLWSTKGKTPDQTVVAQLVVDIKHDGASSRFNRWSNNVHKTVVEQVRGSLGASEQGLIITTSDFSKGAREGAERADATPVGLINGEQLVNLLVEYDIGIHRSSHDIIELGDEDVDQ